MTDTTTLTGEALRDEYLVVCKGWERCYLPHDIEPYVPRQNPKSHWKYDGGCVLNQYEGPPFHTDIGLVMRELITRHDMNFVVTAYSVTLFTKSEAGIRHISDDGTEDSICEAILRCLIEAKQATATEGGDAK